MGPSKVGSSPNRPPDKIASNPVETARDPLEEAGSPNDATGGVCVDMEVETELPD